MKTICFLVATLLMGGEALAGIGVSMKQAMNYLESDFKLEHAGTVDGRDKYSSRSAEKLALIELLGDKNDLSQVTLIVGIDKSDQTTMARNTARIIRLVKNTVPEWGGKSDWVLKSLKKVSSSGWEEVDVGKKRVSMKFYEEMKLLSVSIQEIK